MQYYRHYSFDLWLTLIKSNPAFKTERTRMFFEDYNTAGKSIEEVAAAFRRVDLLCNAINERTGKNIDSDEMYLMVIGLINETKLSFRDIDTEKINDDMEALLFEYPPVLYADETLEVIAQLKQSNNCTMGTLSNTGFIKGATLRKVLKLLDLSDFFEFQLYSDEARMSKPNVNFFNLMIQNVNEVNKEKVSLHEIIHIGDNPYADVDGATVAGIKSMLVNSNKEPISKLLR